MGIFAGVMLVIALLFWFCLYKAMDVKFRKRKRLVDGLEMCVPFVPPDGSPALERVRPDPGSSLQVHRRLVRALPPLDPAQLRHASRPLLAAEEAQGDVPLEHLCVLLRERSDPFDDLLTLFAPRLADAVRTRQPSQYTSCGPARMPSFTSRPATTSSSRGSTPGRTVRSFLALFLCAARMHVLTACSLSPTQSKSQELSCVPLVRVSLPLELALTFLTTLAGSPHADLHRRSRLRQRARRLRRQEQDDRGHPHRARAMGQ